MNAKHSGRLRMFVSLSKGYRLLLVTSVAATVLAIIFNYLTPQVFRFTVDTVLGDEPSALPAFLTAWLNPDGRGIMAGLIACAVAAMACSVLSGIFNYICRYTMAVSSEGMVKKSCVTGCLATSSACPTTGTSRTRPATSSSAAPPTWRWCAASSPPSSSRCCARCSSSCSRWR